MVETSQKVIIGTKFELSSSAFNNGDTIPLRYTGYGEDLSPPLEWANAPISTKSFMLVCADVNVPEDPFIHWLIYNIPAEVTCLEEGILPELQSKDGAMQKLNDFGKIGYNGPKPPAGDVHNYAFNLYALDDLIDLVGGTSVSQLRTVLRGHVLADSKLMAIYEATDRRFM